MKKITITGQTINQLIIAENEMDVTNSYRQFLSRKIPDIVFTSPYQCDGYGVSKKHKLRLLCEFKFKYDFTKKTDWVGVLCQSIFYLKKFEQNGEILPNVLLLGDNNEWLVFNVNDVFEYLNLNINWSLAPSKAYEIKELFDLLYSDENLNPYIFTLDELEGMSKKIKSLAKNNSSQIKITDENITTVFLNFVDKVLGKTTVVEENSRSLTVNETVNLFIQILINKKENYIQPEKKNTLATKAFGDIKIPSIDKFKSFFQNFSREFKPKEKELLTSSIDRLIESETRRKQGEFFTTPIWVNKAHEYISNFFGEDWKEKYVVWDSAWGTGNLTRQFKFKELYVSTLNNSDIQTAIQMGYNPEATKFKFDFLNDDIESLPTRLKNILKSDLDSLMLINPPYATSNSLDNTKSNETLSKKGVSSTNIGEIMKNQNFGGCSDQLYAQYLFRIMKEFKNTHICFFAPPLFLTGASFKQLRETFNIKNRFKSGFLMDSKNFADVSSWGISFCILTNNRGVTTEKNNEDYYTLDILELNEEYEIEKQGEKKLYNTDINCRLNKWVKVKPKVEETYPNFKSTFNIGEKNKKFDSNSLGYLVTNGNNVEKNASNCYIISGPPSNNNAGTIIYPENFIKSNVVLTARKLIKSNWINCKDEYLCPDENHESYLKFSYDSIVYSLFSPSNGIVSLSQVDYKNKKWDIKNEFFWMSIDEIVELANENNYNELWIDARIENSRYLHNLLNGSENIYSKLSPDAKLLIDSASDLVRKSIVIRKDFSNHTNHLNRWDAGYAQLKLLWETHFSEEFTEFRTLYKNFEDRLRPLVYELGFLLK